MEGSMEFPFRQEALGLNRSFAKDKETSLDWKPSSPSLLNDQKSQTRDDLEVLIARSLSQLYDKMNQLSLKQTQALTLMSEPGLDPRENSTQACTTTGLPGGSHWTRLQARTEYYQHVLSALHLKLAYLEARLKSQDCISFRRRVYGGQNGDMEEEDMRSLTEWR